MRQARLPSGGDELRKFSQGLTKSFTIDFVVAKGLVADIDNSSHALLQSKMAFDSEGWERVVARLGEDRVEFR